MIKKEELNISGSVTPTIDPVRISKSVKEIAAQKLKELMQAEGRTVRGIFQCFETPGATVRITYKKYPTPNEMSKRGSEGGLEPFAKSMTDGHEYEVPLYIARFLNGIDASSGEVPELGRKNPNIGTCSYPVHGWKMAGSLLPSSELGVGPNGEIGIPVQSHTSGIAKRVRRYGFQSLEFAGAL